MVKVKREALYRTGIAESFIEEKLTGLRAAGIQVIVKTTEE
jgi:hypothetical protein